MLKTNLSDIFSDLNSESSVILSKSIKIRKIKDTISNTTSSFIPQEGGYSDATSSFMPQKGGYLNTNKNKDIKQLISMLSATSDNNSTDNTEQLKDKLYNILEGGDDTTLLARAPGLFARANAQKHIVPPPQKEGGVPPPGLLAHANARKHLIPQEKGLLSNLVTKVVNNVKEIFIDPENTLIINEKINDDKVRIDGKEIKIRDVENNQINNVKKIQISNFYTTSQNINYQLIIYKDKIKNFIKNSKRIEVDFRWCSIDHYMIDFLKIFEGMNLTVTFNKCTFAPTLSFSEQFRKDFKDKYTFLE